MLWQANPEHNLPGHPESPNRFSQFPSLSSLPIAGNLELIEPKKLEFSLITEIHTTQYINQIQTAVQRAPARLDMGDTYVTEYSWQAALLSAGGAIAAADYSLKTGQPCLSLCRPPGHHATNNAALGFCLLNNIALAARYMQNKGLDRILIVDFDVHHGNGTQDIFEYDPSVYYFSTHQRGIFPGTGFLNETGRAEGANTIQNVPLPAYTGEAGFLALFVPLIERTCLSFSPDAILVSAGYDAHWQDPLASLLLNCSTYHTIARCLKDLAETYCQGRLSFLLEGGYNPKALYHSIEHTLHGLLAMPTPDDPLGKARQQEADVTPLLEQLLHR